VAEIRKALLPVMQGYCEWQFTCCTDDEIASRLGVTSDANDCAERLLDAMGQAYNVYLPTRLTEIEQALVGLERGSSKYLRVDGNAAVACGKALAARGCIAKPSADHCTPQDPTEAAEEPCSQVLVGTQTEGGTCDPSSHDCAPGLICPYSNSLLSVCVPTPKTGDTCFSDNQCGKPLACNAVTGRCAPAVKLGEPCAFTDPQHPVAGTQVVSCAPGLVCDRLTLKCADASCAAGSNCGEDRDCPKGLRCIANECGSPAKSGERCSQDSECADGICHYAGQGVSICSPLLPAGTKCNSDAECASHYCKYGGSTLACAVLKKAGEPCGTGEDCVSNQCNDFSGDTVVCGAGVKEGTTCSQDYNCNPRIGLLCIHEQCTQTPLPDGETCTTDIQCKSGVCRGELCKPKGAPGDACGPDDPPCADGNYCDVEAKSPECAAKKPSGAPCSRSEECWSSCQVRFGVMRCSGSAPGETACQGR
jgi:hypothetical protein